MGDKVVSTNASLGTYSKQQMPEVDERRNGEHAHNVDEDRQDGNLFVSEHNRSSILPALISRGALLVVGLMISPKHRMAVGIYGEHGGHAV